MIKSVHLTNFQSHKDTHIDFSPGVNVLVGPSRNGKTCVLRALRWVVENRPAGDEFRSHWAGKGTGENQTRVVVKLDSDDIVSRIKGSAFNSYILNAEQFEGFGQDVPKPISDALNLDPINFQFQFDPPFLLFDSPGQVARTLNAVVHLEKIDSALANIASLKRSNDQDIKAQEARVKGLDELLSTFPDLEAAEAFITELEGQEKERSEKIGWWQRLVDLDNTLDAVREQLNQTELPEGLENRVVNLWSAQEVKDQLVYTKRLLTSIQGQLAKARAEAAALAVVVGQGCKVKKLIDSNLALAKRRTYLARLRSYSASLEKNRGSLSSVSAIIRQEETKFAQLMPEVCPLCGKV
jgi:DNA repair protein SbcC/Rad50